MPGATKARPLRTLRDCPGDLAATLTSMLEAGEVLYEQAKVADTPEGLAALRPLHHGWVLECLPVLARGFEPESAREFLRANVPTASDGDVNCARPFAPAVRDALELLRGLRATLAEDSR
jgi:hypothetical protein